LRHIRRQLVLFLEHLQLTVRAHVLKSQADACFSQNRLQQVPLMSDVLGEQAVGLEGTWWRQEEGPDQVLVH
jgi:hypothetical protein